MAQQVKRRKNRIKTALRFTAGMLLPALLLTGLLFVWGRKRGHGRVIFSAECFTESSRYLSNPNRGFYYIYGFVIADENAEWEETVAERFQDDTGTNLTMIQINLCNYRDRELTEQGLDSIRSLFQALRGTGKQLIVRFLYDWSGENAETEPEDISVILRHIEQTGPLVAENKDIIYPAGAVYRQLGRNERHPLQYGRGLAYTVRNLKDGNGGQCVSGGTDAHAVAECHRLCGNPGGV